VSRGLSEQKLVSKSVRNFLSYHYIHEQMRKNKKKTTTTTIDIGWLKTAVIVFKCLHGQAPSLYLTELCRPISSDAGHRHLRSAFTRRLIVPRMKTSYGDRSFSVHGPSVWNNLPNDLRLSDMSLETFRSRLKAFLFGHWSLDSPFAAVREFGLYK